MASLFSSNKFDPKNDIPDLSGKVYLVTGGSAGIGFGIVGNLLQHNPAKILLLSMKQEHAEQAMESLKNWGDPSKVEWVQCNLESLKQTDETAKSLLEKEGRLDCIIANAGLGVGVYNETEDGIDSHFQVNVLSQLHLVLSLLPLLQRTGTENHVETRVVFQNSDLHKAASSNDKFESLAEINTDVGPTMLYNRSKLAQVLIQRAMVRRILNGELGFKATDKIYVNATHPGANRTDQQKQAEDAYGTLGKVGVALTAPLMGDPIKYGCLPALFAAASPDIVKDNIMGKYIIPEREVTDPSYQAQDDALGEQCWKLSTQLLRDKIGASWT